MILKRMKSSLFFLSLFILFMLSSITTYASNMGQTEVPVTFTISENDRFNLHVTAIGNGSNHDGNKSIRNGTVVYSLRLNEQKTFDIIPDDEHAIKSISWISSNGTDLSDRYSIKDLKNGTKRITVHGVAGGSELNVEFEAATNNSESGINTPETGDKGIKLWSILFILALIAMIIFKIFEKKQRN